MSKAKKQTPQQVFNQFLFDTMMDQLRSVELYEKEIVEVNKQINDLKKKVDLNNELMNRSPFNNLVVKTQTEKIISLEKSYADTIRTFELKMKEQRGDYHDHIAQLVRENAAAHTEMKKNADVARECSHAQAHAIETLQLQLKNLLPVHQNVCDKILAHDKEIATLQKRTQRQSGG